MRQVQVIIGTPSLEQRNLNAAAMMVLANPLFVIAELLEKEMLSRGMLKEDDLIVFDITALDNNSVWSGWGHVNWLRRVREPQSSVTGLWHNACFENGVGGNIAYEALGHFNVHFNKTGFMSIDEGGTWNYPEGSLVVAQCVDSFAEQTKPKLTVLK